MIFEIADFIDEVYKKNSLSVEMQNYALCKRFANISKNIVQYGLTGFAMVAIVFAAPSLYETIFNGNMSPVLRIYFPFVREDSQTDLAILTAFNLVVYCVGLLGVGPFDILIVFVALNIPLVSSVITAEVEQFKAALLRRNNTLGMTKYRMRSIILMTLKYNE